MAEHFEVPNLPKDTVFYVSSAISIACPAYHAYRIMCDTSTWPDWCTFVPKADVTPPKGHTGRSEVLVKDTKMTLHVSLGSGAPAFAPRMQNEQVVEASAGSENGTLRISWSQVTMPKFVMRTLRVNEFEPGVDNGGASCQYRTWIQMAGPMAYTVKAVVSTVLQARFDDWSQDLKRYAEKTWHEEMKVQIN